MGLTDGQTMAGVGGGGGGGGGGGAVSSRGGPGKVELVLGSARTACSLLIRQRPADKINPRVRWLIKRARFIKAEIAKAIANPNTSSSSLPLATISLSHCKNYTSIF